MKRFATTALLALSLVLGFAVDGMAACTVDGSGGGQTCDVRVVTLVTQGHVSTGTWPSGATTRPNDTNAYAATDVIGPVTSAGGAVLTFANIGPAAGGEVIITSASIEIDDSALVSTEGAYVLYLHNGAPASNLGDNGAFDIPSGDRTTLVHGGKIQLGIPVDEGSTLLNAVHGLNQQITVPAGGTLYGYLVTVAGYTPTAQRKLPIVKLHATGL